MKDLAPLRVLAYTDSQSVGGAELALGYLLGLFQPEIEVGVLATARHVAEAIAAHRPGTSVRTVRPPSGAYDRGALREHVRAVRAFSPNIVHANQAWPWACAYGELAGMLVAGTKVLAVDHLPVAGAIPRTRRFGRRLLARRLHGHVAVGERAAREVEEIVGLPHGSVGAAPNGVPLELASVDAGVAHTHVKPDSGTPSLHTEDASAGVIVGSLGRLTDQKGYHLLVRALPGLPDARLVLVGDGPERASLERLAEELGVAGRLTISGWVDDARSCLHGFDMFALPSAWEGMPLGIIEAMHAGLPVIASDVGSVGEVVADGETGYLVSSGDLDGIRERLLRLSVDADARARMGERGRRVARERFTDTAMAARYEAIYRRLRPVRPGSSKSAR